MSSRRVVRSSRSIEQDWAVSLAPARTLPPCYSKRGRGYDKV
jgi:hypothetical protein